MRSHRLVLGVFLVWITATNASAQECPVAGAHLQPRTRIPVFRYAGTGSGEAKDQFERFQAVVGTKLSTLAEEAKEAGGPLTPLPFLDHLGLYLVNGQPMPDTLATASQRKAYWDSSNALQLLRGSMWPGQPYSVESDIYLGTLNGGLSHPEIRVKLPVQPEDVPTTNDSHSVVTYFALAMETRRLQCDPAIARRFLTRALSIIEDIRHRSGDLTGQLAELETLIRGELAAP